MRPGCDEMCTSLPVYVPCSADADTPQHAPPSRPSARPDKGAFRDRNSKKRATDSPSRRQQPQPAATPNAADKGGPRKEVKWADLEVGTTPAWLPRSFGRKTFPATLRPSLCLRCLACRQGVLVKAALLRLGLSVLAVLNLRSENAFTSDGASGPWLRARRRPPRASALAWTSARSGSSRLGPGRATRRCGPRRSAVLVPADPLSSLPLAEETYYLLFSSQLVQSLAGLSIVKF